MNEYLCDRCQRKALHSFSMSGDVYHLCEACYLGLSTYMRWTQMPHATLRQTDLFVSFCQSEWPVRLSYDAMGAAVVHGDIADRGLHPHTYRVVILPIEELNYRPPVPATMT